MNNKRLQQTNTYNDSEKDIIENMLNYIINDPMAQKCSSFMDLHFKNNILIQKIAKDDFYSSTFKQYIQASIKELLKKLKNLSQPQSLKQRKLLLWYKSKQEAFKQSKNLCKAQKKMIDPDKKDVKNTYNIKYQNVQKINFKNRKKKQITNLNKLQPQINDNVNPFNKIEKQSFLKKNLFQQPQFYWKKCLSTFSQLISTNLKGKQKYQKKLKHSKINFSPNLSTVESDPQQIMFLNSPRQHTKDQ